MILAVPLISGTASAGSVTVAGTHFNYASGLVSTINFESTTNMTWAKGGYYLMKALQNVEDEIQTVDAKVASAVTVTDLDSAFDKYFGAQTDGSLNMWQNLYDLYNQVISFNADLNSGVSSITSYINSTNNRLGSLFSYYKINGSGGTGTKQLQGASNLGAYLTGLSDLIFESSFMSGYYLNSSGGSTYYGSYMSLPYLVSNGFRGLSTNMMSSLIGTDKFGYGSYWSNGSLSSTSYNNLLDAVAGIGSQIQQPLAKLQYVWADDDDIRIADKNKPVKDEIEDNFVGDGSGAVKPSQVGDMASFGSDVQNAFSGAGSPSDVLSVLTDSSLFGFFSQEVAADLDQVGSPAPAADDDLIQRYLSDVDIDEDGFVHPKSSAFWDVSLYLEGLS